jgi:aryl carrier-like protein
LTNDGIGVVRNGVHCMGGDIYGDSDGNCRLTPEKMSGNPSTDCIKKVVSRIWSEVLGVENIDSASNFFELGGDSLQAMQITSRMRRRFGKQVKLRTLLENPTLGTLSAVLAECMRGANDVQG